MSILQGRPYRERVLILISLIVLAGASTFQFLWVPLKVAQIAEKENIRVFRQITQATKLNKPDAVQSRVISQGNISAVTTQSAKKAGIVLRRLQTEGAGIRIIIEETEFEKLINWLSDVHSEYRLSGKSINIERRTKPGIIGAELYLEYVI